MSEQDKPKAQFQVNHGSGWKTIAEVDVINGVVQPPNAWMMVRALQKRVVYTGSLPVEITVAPPGPRETHFVGFADTVLTELLDEDTVEIVPDRWRRQAETIIARRAYDLVAHTIENTAHIDLDRLSTEEHVLRIPDLAELPKEEAEQ